MSDLIYEMKLGPFVQQETVDIDGDPGAAGRLIQTFRSTKRPMPIWRGLQVKNGDCPRKSTRCIFCFSTLTVVRTDPILTTGFGITDQSPFYKDAMRDLSVRLETHSMI